MARLGITRARVLRTAAQLTGLTLIALCLALAFAGPGFAATETAPTSSSGNTTLIVAGLIGAAIAAVWLLKPSRKRPGPSTATPDDPAAADVRSSETDGTTS